MNSFISRPKIEVDVHDVRHYLTALIGLAPNFEVTEPYFRELRLW